MKLHLSKDTHYPFVNLVRTFHPVGQGAFYTEVFNDSFGRQTVMVYDCGTESPNGDDIVKTQIKGFADSIPRRKIDYLFISHLHYDHISGLVDLMNILPPQRILVPMLPIDVILLYRINNLVRYGAAAIKTDNLIQDIYLGSNEGEDRIVSANNVYGIRPQSDYDRDNKLYPRYFNTVNDDTLIIKKIDEPWWRFRPFNSIDLLDQRAQKFLDLVRQIPGLLDNYYHLNVSMVLEEDVRSKLKNAYRESVNFANDNIYTLVVESEPVLRSPMNERDLLAGCVYFGDFCPTKERWKRFNNTIDDYCNIGCVQIPHHGSRMNWRDYMIPQNADTFVISAGYNNSYHHPSYWVIRDLLDRGRDVKVVFEDDSSIVRSAFSFDGRRWKKY